MDKKWNLQDIKPAGGREKVKVKTESVEKRSAPVENSKPITSEPAEITPKPAREKTYKRGNTKRSRRILKLVAIVAIIIGIVFVASLFTSGAEVTVFPKHREPTINGLFTAYQTASSSSDLTYEILTLEADGERQVNATGEEEVATQAEGTITIYKTTPGIQRLIKNTRFEGEEGRIYRITESVEVPGSTDAGPGSVSANVFADQPGEEYNAPAGSRFTVPGLEGDSALFNSIYAENVAGITGGFEGMQFIIDEVELATAKDALHVELQEALVERLGSERPAGFVVFNEAVTFTYESQPAVESGDNVATIKEKTILRVPIFTEGDFAAYIAAATIPGYENEPVRIADYSALSFQYASSTTKTSNIAAVDSIEFQLDGHPLVVWTYDENKLATDLVGSEQTALNQILNAYPAIERARAEIRPFWKKSYPTDISKIEIIEEISQTEGEVGTE